MRKKLTALFLTFCLALTPFASAFAAGGETKGNTENVAEIVDGDAYPTLRDAISAAKDGDTINLLRSAEGPGVIVEGTSKRTLTIDLKGFTYTVTDPVGSTGTETNGFQLLQGSDITFENGTIKAGNLSKILIQNYSNLTLRDVTLDCRGSKSSYALSNNCGNVLITGRTNIYAKENGTAFDLWYGLDGSYRPGVQVTIDENMTGEIVGNIEYGLDRNSSSVEDWTTKTSLTIKGGTFEGVTFKNSSSASGTSMKEANIEIAGGTFQKCSVEQENEGEELTLNDFLAPNASLTENGTVVANEDVAFAVHTAAQLQEAVAKAKPGDVIQVWPGKYNLTPTSNTVEGQTGWLLPITKSITLQGVDEKGNPITDASETQAMLYSTEYIKNGAWSTQNLITVFADNVTLEGLTIMNKIDANKAIEVVGKDKQTSFALKNCRLAPIAKDLLPEGGVVTDGKTPVYSYAEYKEYGASLYFSGGNIEAEVTGNLFENSGISLGNTENGVYNITNNTFKGEKKYTGEDGESTSSTIGFQGKWANPPKTSLKDAEVNVTENTFEKAGAINFEQITDGTMPVFSNNQGLEYDKISGLVKMDDQTVVKDEESLKQAIETAKNGDVILLVGTYGNLSILPNGKSLTFK